jgi:high-affinity nickel-transport protein
VFYNITITSLSIIVAVFIGGLEVLQVMSRQLNLSGGVWDYANNFDLNQAGFVIVGPFILTWAIALSVWRFGHIEEKWSAGLRASERSRASDVDFLGDGVAPDLPVFVVDEPMMEGADVG